MVDTVQGVLELQDGALYYETAGKGAALVFSHAGFLDSGMFDAQWEVFAQQFRVIRYDMRGYGRSGLVTGPACRRDDLCRLLDHLGVSHAHLVGCSIGGQIVLDLALEHPGLTDSLTLVAAAPSGFELLGEPPPHMLEMIEATGRGEVDRANELQIRVWLDGALREPADMDVALRDRALKMNRIAVENRTFLIADMQPARPLDPPAVNRLAEVTCPVLCIVGALDHPEILRAADLMAAQVPGAHREIIPGCGHVPSFERPNVFNPLLFDFLSAR